MVDMSTLTEFLLARIAEDEAHLPDGFDCWYDPDRYVAECIAKRQMIEAIWRDDDQIEDEWGRARSRSQREAENVYPLALQWMATVFADHPDYREEWKPAP